MKIGGLTLLLDYSLASNLPFHFFPSFSALLLDARILSRYLQSDSTTLCPRLLVGLAETSNPIFNNRQDSG